MANILTASQLREHINSALSPITDSKARWKACQSIKWRLYSPQLNLWAGLQGLTIVPVPSPDKAVVFDARDNEERKQSFYKIITGIDWQLELL